MYLSQIQDFSILIKQIGAVPSISIYSFFFIKDTASIVYDHINYSYVDGLTCIEYKTDGHLYPLSYVHELHRVHLVAQYLSIFVITFITNQLAQGASMMMSVQPKMSQGFSAGGLQTSGWGPEATTRVNTWSLSTREVGVLPTDHPDHPRNIGGEPLQAHDGKEHLPDTAHRHLSQVDQWIVVQVFTNRIVSHLGTPGKGQDTAVRESMKMLIFCQSIPFHFQHQHNNNNNN